MPSRHIHRNAVDQDGNPFLIDCVVWNKDKRMSIRCVSVDGKAKKVHQYFPVAAISSFGPIASFLEKQGYIAEAEDVKIPSTKWKELANVHTMKTSKETTTKTEDGWVTSITYVQTWFNWEYTITTEPMLSKQLSIDAVWPIYDTVFTSCTRLLTDQVAVKAAKLLTW